MLLLLLKLFVAASVDVTAAAAAVKLVVGTVVELIPVSYCCSQYFVVLRRQCGQQKGTFELTNSLKRMIDRPAQHLCNQPLHNPSQKTVSCPFLVLVYSTITSVQIGQINRSPFFFFPSLEFPKASWLHFPLLGVDLVFGVAIWIISFEMMHTQSYFQFVKIMQTTFHQKV